jgi:regulator of replication initiation timing
VNAQERVHEIDRLRRELDYAATSEALIHLENEAKRQRLAELCESATNEDAE